MDPHIFDDQDIAEQQPDKTKTQPRYAGFGIRFAASLIDSILATILILPIIKYFFATDITMANFRSIETIMMLDLESMLAFVYSELTYLAITIAVIICFWIYRSATPGKMILGISIVDAVSLKPMSQKQCFIRYLGYYLSMLFFFMGFWWVIFDSRKQGWHDKVSGTLVIHK